jgi:hypothetical protein
VVTPENRPVPPSPGTPPGDEEVSPFSLADAPARAAAAPKADATPGPPDVMPMPVPGWHTARTSPLSVTRTTGYELSGHGDQATSPSNAIG